MSRGTGEDITITAAGFEFHFTDAAAAEELRPLLERIVQRPETLPGFVMRRKGRIRKSLTFRFQLGPRGVYCKRVKPKDALALVKDLFRPSRARNFWEQTKRLEALGFPSPALLAFAERGSGPFVRESLLLNVEVNDAWPLGDYLEERLCKPGMHRERWRFARELGRFVGRMHHAGVAHGDLRSFNLLVQPSAEGARFLLIDNDRTKVSRAPRRRLLLKNLQQINLIFLPHLSMTDRLRFFEEYHAATDGTTRTRRAHLAEIIEACERRLERYVRESEDGLYQIGAVKGYRETMKAIQQFRQRNSGAD